MPFSSTRLAAAGGDLKLTPAVAASIHSHIMRRKMRPEDADVEGVNDLVVAAVAFLAVAMDKFIKEIDDPKETQVKGCDDAEFVDLVVRMLAGGGAPLAIDPKLLWEALDGTKEALALLSGDARETAKSALRLCALTAGRSGKAAGLAAKFATYVFGKDGEYNCNGMYLLCAGIDAYVRFSPAFKTGVEAILKKLDPKATVNVSDRRGWQTAQALAVDPTWESYDAPKAVKTSGDDQAEYYARAAQKVREEAERKEMGDQVNHSKRELPRRILESSDGATVTTVGDCAKLPVRLVGKDNLSAVWATNVGPLLFELMHELVKGIKVLTPETESEPAVIRGEFDTYTFCLAAVALKQACGVPFPVGTVTGAAIARLPPDVCDAYLRSYGLSATSKETTSIIGNMDRMMPGPGLTTAAKNASMLPALKVVAGLDGQKGYPGGGARPVIPSNIKPAESPFHAATLRMM
jgi:hypothetical protein